MYSEIKDIEFYLPKKRFTNDDLKSAFPEMEIDKVEKIGIKSRFISSENETSVDLACAAAEKLFERFDKTKIDFILFCTQTPDYILPTSSCVIQSRLGLRNNIGALDFNLGCSGYIYGLSIARGLVESGIASNVLFLTGETYSKLINEKDRGNRSIFGDAGTATVICGSETKKILDFELGTDGGGSENLIVKNGAFRNRNNASSELKSYGTNNSYTDDNLYMNGPEIFNFTIANIPILFNKTLAKNNITVDDLDYVVFHQANKFMLEYLRKKVKVPKERFYVNLEEVGNTVSNTIPIALKNLIDERKVREGSKILLCGFGVGYSWGATVINL